jgi:predicted DNA-binding transcriptional regulator AlpA
MPATIEPQPMQPPEFVSLSDIADILGVTPRTILNWRKAGQFPDPDVRIGRRTFRWKCSTVAKFLDSQQEQEDDRDD